jgi:cell growth-regulating nucleolar protein
MVVFHCGGCGEALKKNQVDKHLGNTCRRVQTVSCIDCGKDFTRDSYKEHIKCISEQEKYGGANYSAPTNMNKGEKKQNQWFEIVQSAINLNSGSAQAKVLLKRLQSYPNTPRKRAKFINFVNNSIKGFPPRTVEEVWSILENLLPKPSNNEANQLKKVDTEDQNTFEVPEDVDESQSKRKTTEDSEQSSKKQKTTDENDNVQAVPSNPRFEWYDEIKLALSKATDQTLSLDALKKKVFKRYKKLKPNQDKKDDSLFKKLEKKIQRAPFVQQIEENVYRLSE